jgi:zinc protease
MTRPVVGFLCLMLFLTLMGGIAMAGSIFPYTAQKETLPNGLRVIIIPMESPGIVAYYSVVRTGSRDEVEPGKSGFAHFFEHMMFRGTKKYPAHIYDSIVTSIGANANAYTTDDYTCYHLNFAKEDLARVVEIESDRFQHLEYAEAAFQTESGAVYGEYRKSVTSPYALLSEKMQDTAYDVHTYKHTTIGFEADIKAMPQGYEYSKSFFKRFYRPENVIIVVVGDVKADATLKLIKKYYSGWEKGYVTPDVKPEPAQKGERTAEVSYPGKTLPIIDIGYKGDALDPENKDYVAALLFGDLAFGSTSDIYKKLVIQDQKVESIDCSVPVNRDAPLFEVTSTVKDAADIAMVRDAIYSTIEQFKTKPVDAQKLQDIKKRNRYGFLMGLNTPDRVAGGLARFVAITGGIEIVDKLYKAMDAITPDDVMHAAAKYFTPDHRTVVVLKGVQQ